MVAKSIREGAPRAGNIFTPLPSIQVFPGITYNAMYRKGTHPTPPKTSLVFLTSSPWKWGRSPESAELLACFGSAPTAGNRLHQERVTTKKSSSFIGNIYIHKLFTSIVEYTHVHHLKI